MRLRTEVLLAVAIALGAGTASAQSIEITSDLAGTEREGEVLPGTNSTLYILARPGPNPEVAGAELWVGELPASWLAVSTPSPASYLVLGNPFATVPPLRANIVFAPCASTDENGVVLLYTVSLVATGALNDLCLTPQVAVPPSNSLFTTPIIDVLCDPPGHALLAATGVPFIANPVTGQCALGVERSTWGDVKRLYAR